MFETEADGGVHWRMHGCCGRDVYIVEVERVAGLEFGDVDPGAFGQRLVVGDAVTDVELKRVHLPLHELGDTRRAVDLERAIALGHDPVHRDHIVEVADVVAM